MASDATILNIDLAGLALRSPVILAAGTAGYVNELSEVMDLSRVGAVVTKSITALPREGNQTWRIIEHKAGMLNAIGLANVGLEDFLVSIVPELAKCPTTVIGSISGFSIDDYVRVAAAMDEIDTLPAVELNVSCPNVAHGCEFGSDERLLAELIAAVRPVLKKTRLFVKLSPTVIGKPGDGVVGICRAAVEPGRVLLEGGSGEPFGPNQRPGADAMVIANTMPAMAIDVHTRRPKLSRGSGGLSGPAVHPVAVKLVHDAYRGFCKDSGTPIVGLGGVMDWDDAAEFILAGASAVAMGTALFVDPAIPARVNHGLAGWVRQQRASRLDELIGAVQMPT